MKIDPKKVAELMFETDCTANQATTALKLRKSIMEFAIEYLKRRDIERTMSPAERYPKWAQYIELRRKTS